MPQIRVKEGFEIYPEGLYFLEVKNISIQEAKYGDNAGNQFLSWEDNILDAQDEQYIGETYRHTTPIDISPRSKYFPLLEVLGVVLPEDTKEIIYDTDDFIGQQFVASVKIEKISKGRNAGGDKNVFTQVWTPEAFQEQQQKASRMTTRLSSNSQTKLSQPQSGVNDTPNVQENSAPTETVKAPVVSNPPKEPITKRNNIFQGQNLSDFPE